MQAPLNDAAHPPRTTFGPSFEGLFREYRHAWTNRAVARLTEAGVDPTQPLQSAYPTEVWAAAIRILAEEYHGHLPAEAGMREVGRAFMRGYIDTAFGGAMFAVLKIVGPLRSLRRMSRNLRTGNNFSETWLHEDAPGDVRLEVNDCIADRPEFIQGIMEVGLQRVGAKDSSVDVVEVRDDGHVFYRVRWTA